MRKPVLVLAPLFIIFLTAINVYSAIDEVGVSSIKFDFEDGLGPVPTHRYQNPDGSTGGWVADSAFVAKTVFLGPNAKIFGKARVYGNVWVDGNAEVFGKVTVKQTPNFFYIEGYKGTMTETHILVSGHTFLLEEWKAMTQDTAEKLNISGLFSLRDAIYAIAKAHAEKAASNKP